MGDSFSYLILSCCEWIVQSNLLCRCYSCCNGLLLRRLLHQLLPECKGVQASVELNRELWQRAQENGHYVYRPVNGPDQYNQNNNDEPSSPTATLFTWPELATGQRALHCLPGVDQVLTLNTWHYFSQGLVPNWTPEFHQRGSRGISSGELREEPGTLLSLCCVGPATGPVVSWLSGKWLVCYRQWIATAGATGLVHRSLTVVQTLYIMYTHSDDLEPCWQSWNESKHQSDESPSDSRSQPCTKCWQHLKKFPHHSWFLGRYWSWPYPQPNPKPKLHPGEGRYVPKIPHSIHPCVGTIMGQIQEGKRMARLSRATHVVMAGHMTPDSHGIRKRETAICDQLSPFWARSMPSVHTVFLVHFHASIASRFISIIFMWGLRSCAVLVHCLIGKFSIVLHDEAFDPKCCQGLQRMGIT